MTHGAHLSALQLDEQLTGAPPDAHLETCAECRRRLEQAKRDHAALLARPAARALEAKLLERHAARPLSAPLRTVLWLAPLAASLLLFFAWPRGADDGDRVKGAPMVMLLDDKGVAVTSARVGDALSLAVRFSGAEPRQVTVVAVDATGKRDKLWAGSVRPNERVALSQLVVTPGNVEVIAEFAPPASQALRVGVAPVTASTRLEVK
jgi:hypothetical protein